MWPSQGRSKRPERSSLGLPCNKKLGRPSKIKKNREGVNQSLLIEGLKDRASALVAIETGLTDINIRGSFIPLSREGQA